MQEISEWVATFVIMAIEILTHDSGQIQAPTGAPVSQVSPCFISTALHGSNQLLTSVAIRYFQPKLFWVVSWQLQSIWPGRIVSSFVVVFSYIIAYPIAS
jgi:hypothetical protein